MLGGSALKRAIQTAANSADIHIARISQRPFGQDVWLDIKRLSEAWAFPIRCVFDVGANIGQTSLDARRNFANSDIYAFEPHPNTFRQLARRTAPAWVKAFDFAFGEKAGEAELFTYSAGESAASSGGQMNANNAANAGLVNSLTPTSRFIKRWNNPATPITIKVSTIDQFCAEKDIGAIDVLKIDTEGFDLSVLKGAKRMLSEGRIRIVYTEFNDILDRPDVTGGALAPICEFLGSLGLTFVTSYTDSVVLEGEFFAVHNALFGLVR